MSISNTPGQEIGMLNRRWMDSYVQRDTVFLEQHLSDDYVGTFADGVSLHGYLDQ